MTDPETPNGEPPCTYDLAIRMRDRTAGLAFLFQMATDTMALGEHGQELVQLLNDAADAAGELLESVRSKGSALTTDGLQPLIDAHRDAHAKWAAFLTRLDGPGPHDPELKAEEKAANKAEAIAAAMLLAFPPQTLEQAQRKARYFVASSLGDSLHSNGRTFIESLTWGAP